MAKIIKFPNNKKQNLYFKGTFDGKYIFTEKIAKNSSVEDVYQILLKQLTDMGIEVKEGKTKDIKDE
tara:strand:+ start:51 stop:251 length:201 start_codon:yes stop_codon:yes gene_type:complete